MSSHATRQGTHVHSPLRSQSHCGLVFPTLKSGGTGARELISVKNTKIKRERWEREGGDREREREIGRDRQTYRQTEEEDNTVLHKDKDLTTSRFFYRSVPNGKHSNTQYVKPYK